MWRCIARKQLELHAVRTVQYCIHSTLQSCCGLSLLIAHDGHARYNNTRHRGSGGVRDYHARGARTLKCTVVCTWRGATLSQFPMCGCAPPPHNPCVRPPKENAHVELAQTGQKLLLISIRGHSHLLQTYQCTPDSSNAGVVVLTDDQSNGQGWIQRPTDQHTHTPILQ